MKVFRKPVAVKKNENEAMKMATRLFAKEVEKPVGKRLGARKVTRSLRL